MSIIELETNRGKKSIICDNYTYRIDHYLREGVISWRCTQKFCKARVRTNGELTEVLQRKNEHCHEADLRKTERQLLRVRSKRKAIEDANEKPRKIMCSELEGVEKQHLCPADLKSVAQAMYRERRKLGLAPKSSITVKFPPSRAASDDKQNNDKTQGVKEGSTTLSDIIKVEPIDVDEFFEDNEAALGLQEEAVKSKQSSAADAAQTKVMRMGQKNVDIMQILSGAQQRYENKTKGGPEPQNIGSSSSTASGPQLIKPTPVKLPGEGGSSTSASSTATAGDGPSQLQELFKNVKLTQQLQQRPGGMVDQYTGDPPPDVTINPLHRSLSVAEVESGAQARTSAPVSLMSTGSLTVEEIERQQREQIQGSDNAGQGLSQGTEGGMSQSPSTKELLNLIVAAASGDGQGGSLPAMPQLPPNSTGDGGAKGITTTLMTPGDFEKHPSTQSTQKDTGSGGLGATCPDVLLTPMAFATPRNTAVSVSPPNALNPAVLLEQLNNLRRNSPASSGFASPPPPEVTPLTKQQLQQALLHIIRTDDDFVSRVHEAYLTSFRQQLETSNKKR